MAFLALACQRGREDPEEFAARTAVTRYNRTLVEAYRASRADLLTGVASDAEVSRAAAIISGLLKDGRYMEARQTSFDVERTAVARADDGALFGRVDATEAWEYEHRPLDARAGSGAPRKQTTYKLAYLLEKTKAGGWIVAEVIDREHAQTRLPVSRAWQVTQGAIRGEGR